MASDTSPFLSQDDRYESLSDAGEDPSKEDIETARKRALRPPKRRLLYSATKALILLLAAWGLFTIVLAISHIVFPSLNIIHHDDIYRPETLPPGLNNCLCGQTKEEALSLGCTYDSLAASWLPQACRDDPLTEKFDHAGPGPGGAWDYYLDANGTTLLSKAEIAELGPVGGAFWASATWHIAHCAFNWQKYKRMGKTGVIMEARFDTLPHVEHCTMLFMSHGRDYLIEVRVFMNGSVITAPTESRIGGKIPSPSDMHADGQHSHHSHENEGTATNS